MIKLVLFDIDGTLVRTGGAGVKAFARAIELVPDAPQLHADYADVLVRAADGDWTPAASAAVAKALSLDASHPKALWLAGVEAYSREDYGTAVGYWEKLRPMAEQGSECV